MTGAEVQIREGRVIDAIRASVAIPGIFVPQRRGRQLLVDGAIRNPVPVSALEGMNADVRVAVNLHNQPVREIIQSGRRSARRPLRPNIATRVGDKIDAGLARFRRRGPGKRPSNGDDSMPNLFEILTASMTVMEYELARHRLASDPVDVVIEPDVHGIRAFEFHRAAKAIQAGELAASERIAAIQKELRRRLPNLRARKRAAKAT